MSRQKVIYQYLKRTDLKNNKQWTYMRNKFKIDCSAQNYLVDSHDLIMEIYEICYKFKYSTKDGNLPDEQRIADIKLVLEHFRLDNQE